MRPTGKALNAASDLTERLTALGQLTLTDLRTEWRRIYRAYRRSHDEAQTRTWSR